MLKPTNRRSYKEVCSLYEARGLTDYRLRTAEDVKAIHNFDLTDTEGYSDLSAENKELFIKFMISFMNGQGMNLKITVFPRSVHFVRKTIFLKECPPDPEDGKIYKEEIGMKFMILKANGRTKVLSRAGYFDKDKTQADVTHTRDEEFLRVDLFMGGSKTWFHVLAPDRYF